MVGGIFPPDRNYQIPWNVFTLHTSQKEEMFLREQKTIDLRRFCNFQTWFVAIFA